MSILIFSTLYKTNEKNIRGRGKKENTEVNIGRSGTSKVLL
jgi:hypothetical protein